MDKGEETGGELIVTYGNSAELLELEEECFDKMAFLVKPPINEPRVGIIRLGRDTEICVMVGDKLAKVPLAVGSVSENGSAFEVNSAKQFFSDSNVTGVAGRQHDLDRIAQGVHNGVYLRTSAAPADADALICLRLVFTDSCLLGGGSYGFGGF